MRQRIALSTVFLAGAALLASPSAASALGTPGEPNCVGQTNAAIAQAAGPNGPAGSYAPGFGNAARYSNLTVAEAQALVWNFCQP